MFTKVGVCSTHMYHYYIYAIEHTWCDVDPLGRSSFRWAAGTPAGPMSCRIHRQHEQRIQRRRSTSHMGHIKQGYGPLSCHPMDSECKSIAIEDLFGLRPVVKVLCPRPLRAGFGHGTLTARAGSWRGVVPFQPRFQRHAAASGPGCFRVGFWMHVGL